MSAPFLSAEDYDERAHRFYETGEYDEALTVLLEGIRLHPVSVLLHVGIGYVHVAREEYVWARRSFAEALEIDPEYEDAWVGLGETMLKFGRIDEALRCFARVDALGYDDDLEIGLAVGRALYREGLFASARHRFTALVAAHPESAEVAAARGYTLHALGDHTGARRELRRALRLDAELHEARIYLAHLLHDRGETRGALRELERVPPAEHWDTLSVWRYIDLKCSLDGCLDADPLLQPWKERLDELEGEPDEIDHLLAEVELAFANGEDAADPAQVGVRATNRISTVLESARPARHRVRTPDGAVYTGSWDAIVEAMRDASTHPEDSALAFMVRVSERERRRSGRIIACDDAESFLRAAARFGILEIEG